jgi:hypothetical protein
MPKLTASCHCGVVRIEVPRRPRSLTSCNCSICWRYGTLWAYYKLADVRVAVSRRGTTTGYLWGSKELRFVSCDTCRCITHWEPVNAEATGRMGINARNFDPRQLRGVRIKHYDGAGRLPPQVERSFDASKLTLP